MTICELAVQLASEATNESKSSAEAIAILEMAASMIRISDIRAAFPARASAHV
jgi:hypothetical protein